MTRREIAEGDRRIATIARIGRVVEADYQTAKVRLEIGDLITGWIPFLAVRAGGDVSWWAPEVDEQMLVICPEGDTDLGVAVGAIYQAAHPAPASSPDVHRVEYADGAVVEYDRAAHALAATLPDGGTVQLVATGGVTIIGDVTVTGDVIADGISLKTHVHTGVTPGSGLTGQPAGGT